MELTEINNSIASVGPKKIGGIINNVIEEMEVVANNNHFIEANTVASNLDELSLAHIIPVFIKDNEPVISHAEFVKTTLNAMQALFKEEVILSPVVRISHPVKGRVPEARDKPAKELLEHEKTIYYERMAFTIEIPSIHTIVDGNRLNLTVGGVKAYNLDNLYARSGIDQNFKVFIGFKNMVCTNLCVSTDGYLSSLKVKNVQQLYNAIYVLLKDYNAVALSKKFETFGNTSLSEKQFAKLIGRCRMYKHMPDKMKRGLPELMFGDSQISHVCKDYYSDNSFCSEPDGSINLWKLYNLFTNANKSSYVDNFMDRNVNAFELIEQLQNALNNSSECWYIN